MNTICKVLMWISYKWCLHVQIVERGYLKIIHLNRIFHCKPSSYGGTPISGDRQITFCVHLHLLSRIWFYTTIYIYIYTYITSIFLGKNASCFWYEPSEGVAECWRFLALPPFLCIHSIRRITCSSLVFLLQKPHFSHLPMPRWRTQELLELLRQETETKRQAKASRARRKRSEVWGGMVGDIGK